ARTGAPVVLDAPDEAELAAEAGVRQALVRATLGGGADNPDGDPQRQHAAEAGVRQALVRVTLGVDADTHEAIRTGHHGSKFGLPPDQARAAVADALELTPEA